MVRLYRILPLIVVLAVIAVVVYGIMSFRYTPEKAKAVLIKAFFWLNAVLSGVFLLVTAYALLEHNAPVTEMFASCLAVTLIALGVTLICRAVFRKNHPHYGETVMQATIVDESLSGRFAQNLKEALADAVKKTFDPRGRK